MLFVRLVRYLMGYVKVQVSGGFCERFLNVCAAGGISVWNSHRRKDGIELYMPARQYKKVRALRRSCHVTCKVMRKYGLPFLLYRYRRRGGLLAGAAMYGVILLTLPHFIWNIEVVGNDRIETQTVLTALETMNITVGTPISSIHGESDRNRLNLQVDGISWSSLNVVGTTLKVEMRETLDVDQEKDTSYCNIVAKCDGKVVGVYADKGTALVKSGAQVQKGDLLISGTEEYSDGSTHFRRATGKVLAKTEHTLTVSVPITQTVNQPTGRKESRTVLCFFGMEVPLFTGSIAYPYERETDTETLELNDTPLPIQTVTATFYEIKKQKRTIPDKQLKKQAAALLQQKVETELSGVEILSQTLSYQKTDTHMVLTANYQCKENIAQTVPFEVEENFEQ